MHDIQSMTFVQERLLYLAKIIHVINGPTLCVISSIGTPPSTERVHLQY